MFPPSAADFVGAAALAAFGDAAGADHLHMIVHQAARRRRVARLDEMVRRQLN